MKLTILLTVFLLFTYSGKAQSRYVLALKEDGWNFKPSLFYFSDIVDERKEKDNAGKAYLGGKIVNAVFNSSLSSDLKILLARASTDTSFIPLTLSIERFRINETGTSAHHTMTLDFSLKIYRILNNKRYQLYESSGNPSMEIHGDYPNAAEKIITQSLRKVTENFNDWLNENADLPPLAKSVAVIFLQDSEENSSGDTIIWSDKYKLKWNDFKGKPFGSFSAQSNCLFDYHAEPAIRKGVLQLKINMYACFDRKNSFVKPGLQRDTLLAHEQLHFDICELYMRLLRQKILNMKLDVMEFDSQIRILFNKAWNDYQEEQQKYDEETGHGIFPAQQQKWQAEIKNKLNSLSFDGSSVH